MSGTRAKRVLVERAKPASDVLAGLSSPKSWDCALFRAGFRSRRLGFGEIQFHADAVGIVHEELRVAGARHDTLAELHLPGLKALAHALDVGRGKGDVIEPAGVFVFLLGAAHDDTFARL